MRVLKDRNAIDAFLLKLHKRGGGGASPSVLKTVGKVVSDVKKYGDSALRKYTLFFEGHEDIVVPPARIDALAEEADKKAVRALKTSAARIRRFHLRQKERPWLIKAGGSTLGQMIRPIERVGIYVPGGKASYPSTVLMNVIPAQVAGVREIAVSVPAPGGAANPLVMAALRLLGVSEVYCIGGAQAVAALAYGTETVRKVDKVTGPGNVYVASAKRMVFGQVDIDMIAGPSEILVIADKTADASFVTADLLSQAEHDETASAILITDSEALAGSVVGEIKSQIRGLPKLGIARRSLAAYGAVILVGDMAEAAEISNIIAPEHLEIITRAPRRVLPMIKNAGAVFLGPWTPEPLGDYSAGPNHTLPTGATSRWASALGVYDFIKRTSVLEFDRNAFMSLAETVETLALAEGLEAHARAVAIRARSVKRAGQGRSRRSPK